MANVILSWKGDDIPLGDLGSILESHSTNSPNHSRMIASYLMDIIVDMHHNDEKEVDLTLSIVE
jgi:hypothetical protein